MRVNRNFPRTSAPCRWTSWEKERLLPTEASHRGAGGTWPPPVPASCSSSSCFHLLLCICSCAGAASTLSGARQKYSGEGALCLIPVLFADMSAIGCVRHKTLGWIAWPCGTVIHSHSYARTLSLFWKNKCISAWSSAPFHQSGSKCKQYELCLLQVWKDGKRLHVSMCLLRMGYASKGLTIVRMIINKYKRFMERLQQKDLVKKRKIQSRNCHL